MLRRALWIVIPVLVLAGLYLLTSNRAVEVDVGQITRGTIRSSVEEEGRTRVRERYVVSMPEAGRLLRVDLEEGDTVKAGDVIARLEALPLETAVREQEAQVRALAEEKAGVAEKRPKKEEIEHAELLEQQARASLEVQQRELDRLQAEATRLQKDLSRTRELARQHLVPQSDLDDAVAADVQAREAVRAQEVRVRVALLAIDTAKTSRELLEAQRGDWVWEEKAYAERIQGLEATVAKLQDDLGRAELHAPVSGVVLRRMEESQRVLAAGTPLIEIGNLADLEVEADFLSEDAAHMRKGMRAEITGRAVGDQVIPATVTLVYPSAFKKISSLGVEQQRVTVVVAPEQPVPGLGDRYRVEVRVVLEAHEDAVLVPESALFRVGGAWSLFQVEGGRAHLRRVETGLGDGLSRELLQGPPPGASVVLHPGDALEDGVRVEALPAGAAR